MKLLSEATATLGHTVIEKLWQLGFGSRFFLAILLNSGICLRRPLLVVKEMYSIGVQSLVIILVSGLFIGLVLGLQMYNTLERFGSGDSVGAVVALALIRELGPVLTALLFAGRAGSAVTAEIGLMKTTEQLDALEMMAIQPIARIIAPRFWAGFFSLPLLTSLFNVIGIYGAYIISVNLLGIDTGIFWPQMQDAVGFREDVLNGIIKSIVFAVTVILIAVFEGYTTSPTAEGVSKATTRTVVNASVAVLGLDFILTAFMFQGI
jgi:phospholipid/cholesterol/gamma-HCH transport system permease protein